MECGHELQEYLENPFFFSLFNLGLDLLICRQGKKIVLEVEHVVDTKIDWYYRINNLCR